MRRATETETGPKSREMLKLRPTPVMTRSQNEPSELDVYFPVQPVPAVTTHLLVPLAATPTVRLPLPLSARNDGGGAHPLLPIANLASIHTTHRLHSLRVSTLFSRLDTANVWDDPGVNVDAYAFGLRHTVRDTQEKRCTVLRVTFRGRIATSRSVPFLATAQKWCSLEETHPGGHPILAYVPDLGQIAYENTRSQSPLSLDQSEECDVPSHLPVRAGASAQHDLVLPVLDFSSGFSDAVDMCHYIHSQ